MRQRLWAAVDCPHAASQRLLSRGAAHHRRSDGRFDLTSDGGVAAQGSGSRSGSSGSPHACPGLTLSRCKKHVRCIMKLRIKGNSIRLRLGQAEVRRLAIDGAVEEFTMFGPSDKQLFGYALCASLGQSGVTATFADSRMTVCVPVRMIHE